MREEKRGGRGSNSTSGSGSCEAVFTDSFRSPHDIGGSGGSASLWTLHIALLQLCQQASALLTHTFSVEPPFSISTFFKFYVLNSVNISSSQEGGRAVASKK